VYGQGKPVDGVIALDQTLVQLIVKALGAVELPTQNGPLLIRDDNLLEFMRAAWGTGSKDISSWFPARKEFVGDLAKAIQHRMARANVSEWLALTSAVRRGLNERHLLIYLFDPTWAPVLASAGWDGSLHSSESDFLMLVDSNVGFSKSNPLVKQKVAYTVSIGTDLSARATLGVAYLHSGQPSEKPCQQRVPTFVPGVSYESMIDGCYFDYLRLYVPQGSVLRDESRQPIAADVLLDHTPTTGRSEVLSAERDTQAFAKLVTVSQGGSSRLTYAYDLPQRVVRSHGFGTWQYTLYWQKQPGTSSVPATIVLSLPRGTSLMSTTPSASAVESLGDSTRVKIQVLLDSDKMFDIVFRSN
ncbi:MAG: DUF4012 domain-containing protein, partial [Chloroflexi bacterium]|nr:DUF4012 domain-containing protein [Chloroflexota bacterium]